MKIERSLFMAIAPLQPVLKTMAMSERRFLYGLDKTPDDRLSWSPGGEGKTPLDVAGRVTGFVEFFTHMLQNHTMPERPSGPAPSPGSREEAKASITAALQQLRAHIERMTESDLTQSLPTPWGTAVTASEMLGWIGGVMGYWQGQLNYIQTIYGDVDPNMPPGWGHE
jgi:hypothetical protein